MSETKKTIEISEEIYNAIQQLKGVFSELTATKVEKDEDVLGILVSGFIESLMAQQGHSHGHNHDGCSCETDCNCSTNETNCGCQKSQIITE